jgi:hypothetical protein
MPCTLCKSKKAVPYTLYKSKKAVPYTLYKSRKATPYTLCKSQTAMPYTLCKNKKARHLYLSVFGSRVVELQVHIWQAQRKQAGFQGHEGKVLVLH